MSEWIKCSDRIPECTHECTSEHVMVSDTFLVTDSGDPTSLGLGHMRSDGSWLLYGGDFDFMCPEVTHWMPLPSPPEDSQ